VIVALGIGTAAGLPFVVVFWLWYLTIILWVPFMGLVSAKKLWEYRVERATPRASIERIDLTGLCYGITVDEGEVRLWAIPGPLEGNNIIVVLLGLGAWLITAVLVGTGLPWGAAGGTIKTVSPIVWVVALVAGSIGALCAWWIIRRPNWTEVLLESKGPLYVRRQAYTGDESEESIHRDAFGKLLLVRDREASGIQHKLALKVEGRRKPKEVLRLSGVIVQGVRGDVDRLSQALLTLAGRADDARAEEAE
jgi:hypothetical protein